MLMNEPFIVLVPIDSFKVVYKRCFVSKLCVGCPFSVILALCILFHLLFVSSTIFVVYDSNTIVLFVWLSRLSVNLHKYLHDIKVQGLGLILCSRHLLYTKS